MEVSSICIYETTMEPTALDRLKLSKGGLISEGKVLLMLKETYPVSFNIRDSIN